MSEARNKVLFSSIAEKEAYLNESRTQEHWVKLETAVPCTSQDCLNAAYVASIAYDRARMEWRFIAICKDCVIRLGQMYGVSNVGTVEATRTDIGPVDNP